MTAESEEFPWACWPTKGDGRWNCSRVSKGQAAIAGQKDDKVLDPRLPRSRRMPRFFTAPNGARVTAGPEIFVAALPSGLGSEWSVDDGLICKHMKHGLEIAAAVRMYLRHEDGDHLFGGIDREGRVEETAPVVFSR